MLWWIAAGVVVGAELLTGTIYLLLLAVGMAAAGWAASMGATPATQMLVCAAIGGIAMLLLWQWRRRRSGAGHAATALDLDIGQRVKVMRWQHDGHATVHYRGAPWQARWQGPTPPPGPGDYAIVAVDGARLVLGAVEPASESERTT